MYATVFNPYNNHALAHSTERMYRPARLQQYFGSSYDSGSMCSVCDLGLASTKWPMPGVLLQ